MPNVYVLNFSDDPYINIIFLCTMVNRLFCSPRNPKYILTEPQMPKTVFKSLQRQQRNQTFKYSCNPVVYTDYTGQFNTKYAAICRKVSPDWTSIIPIFDNIINIIIISVLEPVFLYRGLGFLTSLPRRRPLHSERF